MILRFIPCWVVLSLLWSCNTSSPSATNHQAVPSAEKSIPVFEQFAEIATIFEQQTDSTYVINFWATWCKPCIEELPYFEELHDQFPGEKLRVILVSMDFPNQIESKLIPFVKEQRLRSDVMALIDLDYNSWIDKVTPEWSGAIPVTMIYNAKEKKFIDRQFESAEELKQLVKSFL
ncbi:MAG: hypothetical protein DHS20C18_26620 [Saprospiraceae bacterium]|nr:MAG: hypothetical protein DHS20C18_26620 [Saprospiraceae bacterium]